jgi:hypothetical protein
MSFVDVTIEPKQEGKGRSFRAICLGWATADKLWEGGAGGNVDVGARCSRRSSAPTPSCARSSPT